MNNNLTPPRRSKSEKRQKQKEKLKVSNLKRISSRILLKIALKPRKTKHLKEKVIKRAGVSKSYWDHTKNYSELQKKKRDELIHAQTRSQKLYGLLKDYYNRNQSPIFLDRIIKISTKERPLHQKERKVVKVIFKKAWLLLAKVPTKMSQNPGYYEKLRRSFNSSAASLKKVIKRDIIRTPEAKDNKDLAKKLQNVLLTFVKRNKIIGYCQGLNFIASYLFTKNYSEEQVFWFMVFILEELMPNEYYTNMLSVLADMNLLEKIIRAKFLKLADYLKKKQIDLVVASLPCFITLFTNCAPEVNYFFYRVY